jgi:hypothetical protein
MNTETHTDTEHKSPSILSTTPALSCLTREVPFVWFLLRFGVAFTFLYASISAFINPDPWLAYFPDIMRSLVSDSILLMSWGTVELVIGLWLLSGYRIFIPSIAAAGLMLGVFMFDFASFHIIFRNVCILATSISLAIISNPHYHFHLHHRGVGVREVYEESSR